MLINKTENTGLKHLNDFKAFIEILKNFKIIEECNLKKKRHEIMIIFDDIIDDMLSNKKNLM